MFDGEIQFEMTGKNDKSHFILCLVPKSWVVSLKTSPNSVLRDAELFDKLRQVCSLMLSGKSPGFAIGCDEFLAICERKGIEKSNAA